MPQTRIADLTCDYATNPLGIGARSPRLGWKLRADRRGARQSAYRILVADTEDALRQGRGTLWDTGRVESNRSVQVPYEGRALGSGQRAWWKVCVWDDAGAPGQEGVWSEASWWEAGLLERSDWQAEWIGAPLAGGPWTSAPCPFLRKEFTLARPVAAARLYATALGLYECWLNGERVGSDNLTPGWTDYNKRVQYQAYDVTGLLRQGANAVGALLGDGWYCGHVEWRGRQRWGDRPKLLAQLVVRFADGETLTVATDGTWTVAFGPLLEADLLMGESYDARREMPGWCEPGLDGTRWTAVETFADPGVPLVAMRGPAVRAHEELTPVAEPRELPGWPASKWVFDLGQNMVGRVRLKVSGPAGATVTLRHAEALNPDGTLYTTNLRSARQTDHYTLKGGSEEVWEPRFTFHGFRYVELSGVAGRPDRGTVTGIVLHSHTPPTGEFECSDPLLNQLQHNIQWGQKGNFVDVPTDCPQRDERLGWTGDAQVFIRTAAFNMGVAGFFTKWLQDLEDAQADDGAYPPIAPNTNVVGSDGGPAWADAGIICPWTLWQCYGDTQVIEEHWDGMVRFMDYLRATARDHIRCYPGRAAFAGFGDWLSINAETPQDLIGTAFYAYSARLMSGMAAAVGKQAEAGKYARIFDDVRKAFCERYVTPGGLVASMTQTACVLALHFDLAPHELRPAVADLLVSDIERRGMHLSTGFVGSPYLPHVLSANGRLDVAYALLHQTTWPSWLYSVTKGATTIWERWDGWTEEKGFQDPGMNSFNHYAYGAIGAWLYATVAGIDVDPAQPGYEHILLRPQPGGALTHARAALESVRGRIESDWRLADGVFHWSVTVPPNATATAWVPASGGAHVLEGGGPADEAEGVHFVHREGEAAVYTLQSGRYAFTGALKTA